ncbi:MAG: hypothetical protein FWD44_09885 [Oscillospiraceae bacterium]|nr:hypothetical protein [Oscillospiraceae bacterium]
MIKLLTLTLALFAVLSLTTCGGAPNGGNNSSFTPPDLTFTMDGTTLGVTRMSSIQSKFSGAVDNSPQWVCGEEIDYPIGTTLTYWFNTDGSASNYVARMGYGDPALSWIFFDKYRVGDDATEILLDLTGLAGVSALKTFTNVIFNDGGKQVSIWVYSDNEYHLFYINGGYEAEIQVYDNTIIKVNMCRAEIDRVGN